MEKVNNKIFDLFLSYLSNKVNMFSEVMEDLKKNVDDFDKVVIDYKMNLDLIEYFQEVIEEVFFFCCNFIFVIMLFQKRNCFEYGVRGFKFRYSLVFIVRFYFRKKKILFFKKKINVVLVIVVMIVLVMFFFVIDLR